MTKEELVNISDVKIGFSVLSGDVYLYIPDERGIARIKIPCEKDLMFALVGHMMHDSEYAVAVEKDICVGNSWYKISVEKIDTPDDEE